MNLTVKVKIYPTEEQKVFYRVYRINVDTPIIFFPTIEKNPRSSKKSKIY
jgi:hypothetical protein